MILPISKAFLTPTTAIEFSTLVFFALPRPNRHSDGNPSDILKTLSLFYIILSTF